MRVFESANNLAKLVYQITKSFPRNELFGITSQLRRAALSVPTNIVEGSQRHSQADYLRFLDIALGSLAETGYLLEFSAELGYIDKDSIKPLIELQQNTIKSLNALINHYRNHS